MANQMRRPVMTRSTTQWADWGNIILGIILFISPWYSAAYGASAWNAWVSGVAIVVVALWARSNAASPVPEWINLILGVWVFISPWVLGFTGLAGEAWSAWIIGFLVVILSGWALTQRQRPNTAIPA